MPEKDKIDEILISKYEERCTVNPSLYNCNDDYLNNIDFDNISYEKITINEIFRGSSVKKEFYEVLKGLNGKKEQQQLIRDLINPNKNYERLGVDIITILVGKKLLPVVDPDLKGSLMVEIAQLRQDLTDSLGYVIPNYRIMDYSGIAGNEYQILIRGKAVFKGSLPDDDIENNNVDSIIKNLTEICIKYVHKIMTKTDVLKIMELTKSQDPTLINDLVPLFLSPIDLKKIFANLISQRISIRDIVFIFEILNDHARYTRDTDKLTKIIKYEMNF